MSQVPSWQSGGRRGDDSQSGGRRSDDSMERVIASTFEDEKGRRIPCPVCGFPIGAVRGSKAAICRNCGFKDGCC
jgi:DNA-directed RNA polymerase subunit RPC12/RpoP